MANENTGTFDECFGFSRARPAEYRNASGAIVTAPVDVPRLDFAISGQPLGLRMEGVPLESDSIRLLPGLPGGPCVVLHKYITEAGVLRCRAILSEDARPSIDAALNVRGYHQRIAVVSRSLVPEGAATVDWRGDTWTVLTVLDDGTEQGIDAGAGIPLGGA